MLEKIRKMLFKKSSIIFTFLLSYLCILLIPILIGVIIFNQSINVIENEINRGNTAILKQVQQNIDSRLREIEQLSLKIGLDSRVIALMNSKDKLDIMERYTMYQVLNDFRSYIVTNNFINNFYVYFKNADSILTSKVSHNPESFYSSLYKQGSITYNEWYNFIRGEYKRYYGLLTSNEDISWQDYPIIFAQSMPIDYPSDALATIVIQLDERVLEEAIKNIEWMSQGKVFVMNSDNQILFSTEQVDVPESLRYEKLIMNESTSSDNYNNEDVIISYTTSEIADWKYVSIVSVRTFMEKASNVRNLANLSLILIIIMEGALVYYFIKKNYNPVKEIIQGLIVKTGISINNKSNEYQFIKEAISKTVDEKKKIEATWDKQKDSLRRNFLMRLIKGRIDSIISIEEACEIYNIKFDTDKFSVLIFYIDDFSNLFFENNHDDSQESLEMVHYIMTNVIEELISQNNIGYMVEVDDFLVCLVNFKKDYKGNTKQDMVSILNKAKEFIEKNFAIYFFASISDIHEGFSQISHAYQEAIEAIEYRIIMGNGSVIHYDDIRDCISQTVNSSYSVDSEQQFVNCINAGDYKGARRVFNNIVENNFNRNIVPINIVKCRLFGLMNTMINVLGDNNIICEIKTSKGMDPIDALINCETVKELQSQLDDILVKVEEYSNEKAKNQNNLLKERMMQYIEEVYQDINLNVSMIADKFELTIPYLSRFFKKQTGTGLLDYIHKIRITKAKELINEEDLSIKEIAKRVGYINSDALIRVFKKLEGITPGKYKKM